MGNNQKMCFVVQGFGEKTDYRTGRKLNLDASYDVIKEAVENAGLKCIRADEIQHSQIIDKPMYECILNADLVIADLSTSNVNAAYELGVRHALCRRSTIIVAEKQWDFPFDINRNAIRTYEHLGSDIGRREAKRFSADLTQAITSILADQDAVDSPLYTFVPSLLPPGFHEEPVRSGTRELKAAGTGPPVSYQSAGGGKSVKGFTDQARTAMEKNDFLTAKIMYKAAHEMRPNDESIIQKLALTTYKSKLPSEVEALREAHDLIRDKLAPQGTNDPETIGLWAAVHKRLWPLTKEIKHLQESIDALERGFKLQNDYYNGINLAYMLNVRATLTGTPPAEAIADYVQAQRTRLKVIDICKAALAAGIEDSEQKYWVLATLWEACAGIDDEAGARQWMAEATRHVEDNQLPGWMLNSTKDQCSKLRELLEPSPLRHISA
jgi:tetratricopeptide (TPR) repeat protein